MLLAFVKQHQKLFGEEEMVMVVHLLKHLGQSVRKLGPLWCHSAFPFERNNGRLLKLANGTSDVMHQISSKYCLQQSINNRKERTEPPEYSVTILLGKGKYVQESTLSILDYCSSETFNFANDPIYVHARVKFQKNIFTSQLYTRPKRSIDYFVGLKNGLLGTAKYYFKYREQIRIMLIEYEVIDTIDHIHKVLRTNRLIIAPVNEIEKKYLFMNVGLNYYVTCRPNPYENE